MEGWRDRDGDGGRKGAGREGGREVGMDGRRDGWREGRKNVAPILHEIKETKKMMKLCISIVQIDYI